MCNLYSMTATVEAMRSVIGAFDGDTANLPPFDEIYPGKLAPVLFRPEPGKLKLELMEWGFPGPQAAKGRSVTNVRNLESPFWRNALVNPVRRCVVPVTRFCEWTEQPDPETKRKAKVWFGLHEEDEPWFAFPGIWRPGPERPFMAFLTCAANSVVGEIHPKAMPVMLRPGQIAEWLDNDHASACALAQPFADAEMRRLV
ncbi:DUF159 family protein [Sphingomonas ginkgonis]|uniref:Abasic site processing protein n=1 Tax=Sphingomonas ginkgonis TaxID=2315330 RepID=A0A3R9WQE1_9SPHN|nr:SOS response-associated peptidase family protein [Sphingomonas ginkgonis]RST30887.1 DUF159 family protein [Sphingomonas ginkgonis]